MKPPISGYNPPEGVKRMQSTHLEARFETGEELADTLTELRRSGALCHTGKLPYPPGGVSPTLYLSVRPEDAALAVSIIRRCGGRV